MFGNNKRLERHLNERGVRAPAEVLEATQTHMAVTVGNEAIVSNTEVVWKLRVLVKPDPGQPFEAELKERFPQLSGPAVGQILRVLYDPEDHSRIVMLHDQASQLDAAIGTALSNSPAIAANPGLAGPLAEMMRAATQDPQGFREQMRTQGPAAFGLTGGVMPGTPPAQPTAEDPLDRLAKLADLHERGALTDEEFAEQKRKILEQ